MVFQKPLLFPHLSVADNVGFGLRMRRVPRGERRNRVAEALVQVQLDGYGPRRVNELSGGQEQRVALARALVTEPRVLLLDEPFSALDASLRSEMRELLRRLQAELGVTTLLVTHDQAEAVEVADSIALLIDGRLEQHDEARTFFERPRTVAAARFFGAKNLLAGTRRGRCFETAAARLEVEQPGPDGAGVLVVRPEALRLTACEGANVMPGVVVSAHYRGTHTMVTVSCPGELTLRVSAAPDVVVAIGAPVGVHVPPEAAVVVPPR